MAKSEKEPYAKLGLQRARRITSGLCTHGEPAWSRDGARLAFSVGEHRDSCLIISDHRGRIARCLEGPTTGAATFSPSGDIAYTRCFGDAREVWLSLGGAMPSVRLLGGDGNSYFDPAFSPDGATLACAILPVGSTHSHLLMMDLATGQRVHLPSTADRSDARPSYSPHGDEILFSGTMGEDLAAYSIHLVENKTMRLTSPDEHACSPSFIDENTFVYAHCAKDGTTSLRLYDRALGSSHAIDDGTNATQPACFVDEKRKVKLAYVGRPQGHAHFDVYTARLRGGTARTKIENVDPEFTEMTPQ